MNREQIELPELYWIILWSENTQGCRLPRHRNQMDEMLTCSVEKKQSNLKLKDQKKKKCLFVCFSQSHFHTWASGPVAHTPNSLQLKLIRSYLCQLTHANKLRRPRFAQQMVHEKSFSFCYVCAQHSWLHGLTCCQHSWATWDLHCLTLELSGFEIPPSSSFWGTTLMCRDGIFGLTSSSELRGIRSRNLKQEQSTFQCT